MMIGKEPGAWEYDGWIGRSKAIRMIMIYVGWKRSWAASDENTTSKHSNSLRRRSFSFIPSFPSLQLVETSTYKPPPMIKGGWVSHLNRHRRFGPWKNLRLAVTLRWAQATFELLLRFERPNIYPSHCRPQRHGLARAANFLASGVGSYRTTFPRPTQLWTRSLLANLEILGGPSKIS